MGTKRKKGGELPTSINSLSYVAAEQQPPAKALKTTDGTVARRFGFKGSSISQLPTPTTSLASLKTKISTLHSTDVDNLTGTTTMNGVPIDLDVRVLEKFEETFGEETVAAIEQLLAFRYKTNKFAVKARKEEEISYIKQLKGIVGDVSSKIREFSNVSAAMDEKITATKTALGRRLAVLEHAAKIKDHAEAEHRQLKREFDIMQKRMKQICASELEAISRNEVLQDNAAKLELQLEESKRLIEQMKVTLKAYEAHKVEESRRFEEEKRAIENMHEKKGLEESKRKQAEVEKLQDQISKTREELALIHKKLDGYKDKAIEAANSLNQEYERRTKSEMEKCTLEAKNQVLEARVNSAASEVAELKERLQHKDDEVSNLVKSLTDIQKVNASANSKTEADKKELSDKIERLQTTIRNLERQESSSSAAMRDLKAQLEVEVESRKKVEQNEQGVRDQLNKLEAELRSKEQKVSVEGGVRQMLETQVRELRTEHVAVNAQLQAVKVEMTRLQLASAELKKQHHSQHSALEAGFQQERDKFKFQIDKLQEEKVSLESELETLRTRASSRDGDIEDFCEIKREADILRRRLNELTSQGAQSIAEKDSIILELQDKIKQGDKLRRAMHNTIQELRGNVRVYARTRPFLPSDRCDPNTTTPVISCDFDGESLKLCRPGKTPSEPDTFSFSFDKVFAPSSGQDAVFDHVSEFVQSALDGYHVCLFSYGQTGSGKTHTMLGSGNGQMRGIIPRAISMILHECDKLKLEGWNYVAKVSFLEIYNEALKDLLATKSNNDEKLTIKKDAKGGVYVPGLTLMDVTTMEQAQELMERASRARSVACTDMNAQSSRSHSVFTLHLQGVNDTEGVILNGQLNLVDLAGSERASRSNVSGERLKETQAINKSLSSLADVFAAIRNKSSHIPFRNSKLTYLLQRSLSGDGKTLMMVNLSPTLESASESLCSLRFAQQVNQCELGKPRRLISRKSPIPFQADVLNSR